MIRDCGVLGVKAVGGILPVYLIIFSIIIYSVAYLLVYISYPLFERVFGVLLI